MKPTKHSIINCILMQVEELSGLSDHQLENIYLRDLLRLENEVDEIACRAEWDGEEEEDEERKDTARQNQRCA